MIIPMKSKRMKNTSWTPAAQWYDSYLEGEDTYQRQVILPNLLRLLAPLKGKRLLDVGCGQGFFSRECAAAGARVVGVDASFSLIELAKQSKGKERIEYFVAPAQTMGTVVCARQFDVAVIVLALQNMERPSEVLKECVQALVPGGSLFVVLNHPAFRVPKHSDWGFDEKIKVQYRRVDQYLTESKEIIDMKPSMPGKVSTISFHRPLQVYVKNFVNAGFLLRRMEEWTSHKKSEPGPRQKAENQARKEFPLFLMVEAVRGK